MPTVHSADMRLDHMSNVDISVLITTRDMADRLAATLQGLIGLRTARLDWNLLVVNNRSRNAAAQVIGQVRKCWPVRVLALDRTGKCRAQNLALKHGRWRAACFYRRRCVNRCRLVGCALERGVALADGRPVGRQD